MFVFLTVVTIIVFILLIVVAGARPIRSTMSLFELQRRADDEDQTAAKLLRRERLLCGIYSLQRILTAFLLAITILLLVATFGWLWGTLLALIVSLAYGALSRQAAIERLSRYLYNKIEPALLKFIERFPRLSEIIRSVPMAEGDNKQLGSRQELQHLVAQSGSVLTDDEKKLIAHSLSFETQPVSEVMTPRSMIDSVPKTELLGPLVLDKLHKTGHSRFPVTDGDIDHVVGMLYIQDLLTLGKKKSATAAKTMEPRVFYIRQDQTLSHALAAFLRTHRHLFIVVNEYRETVGLLTLEDVIEALIGREIVDEFEVHEDLRAVAARNPRKNNRSPGSKDV